MVHCGICAIIVSGCIFQCFCIFQNGNILSNKKSEWSQTFYGQVSACMEHHAEQRFLESSAIVEIPLFLLTVDLSLS